MSTQRNPRFKRMSPLSRRCLVRRARREMISGSNEALSHSSVDIAGPRLNKSTHTSIGRTGPSKQSKPNNKKARWGDDVLGKFRLANGGMAYHLWCSTGSGPSSGPELVCFTSEEADTYGSHTKPQQLGQDKPKDQGGKLVEINLTT